MENENLVALAKEYGIQNIRCSLTGQVIATLTDEILDRAISYEIYENPLADAERIIDSLQVRWLILSSKPAPHLIGHKSLLGFKFLRTNHPKDLFAILTSRLLFDSLWIKKQMVGSEIARKRMAWLVEFWDSTPEWTEAHQATLEQLIRLDAIHNVRRAIYDPRLARMLTQIQEGEYTFETLLVFIDEVENSSFIALSKMKNPPNGNQYALGAALDQHGMTPDNIIRAEERKLKTEERRRAGIAAVSANGYQRHGNVVIHRNTPKTVFTLAEMSDHLPPALAAKYEQELAERKVIVNPKTGAILSKPKGELTKRQTNSKSKSAARFGSLDIDF